MSTEKRAPLVIMGMHRSGTTLVVQILRRFGFFAGVRLGRNLEATFFRHLNEWLMRRAGGAWDYPLPIKALLAEEAMRERAVEVLRAAVSSRRMCQFTGSVKDALFNTRSGLDGPWGWKDPRSTFTLPLWLDVFPDAKVVLIERNGVDVAASLYKRAVRELEEGAPLAIRSLKSRFRRAFDQQETYFFTSVRCSTSHREAFSLWEEYTEEALKVYEGFGGEKFSLRYEDLLLETEGHIRGLLDFCGLSYTDAELVAAASAVRSERAYAFTEDDVLRRFYDEVRGSALMQRLGYGDIPLP